VQLFIPGVIAGGGALTGLLITVVRTYLSTVEGRTTFGLRDKGPGIIHQVNSPTITILERPASITAWFRDDRKCVRAFGDVASAGKKLHSRQLD